MHFNDNEIEDKELSAQAFTAGEGTQNEPFCITIPKTYKGEDLARLFKSISSILVEEVNKDGSMFIKLEKE